MFTSFSTALSGLNADAVGVDVVGNNLANLNTPGFKASTVSFYDMVSESLGVGSGDHSPGMGTGRPTTVRQFTQGQIQASGGTLDAAIQGNGFFIVKDSSKQILYTRAGNFHVDTDGYLLSATGERVQGWQAANGVLGSTQGDLIIPANGELEPEATTTMSVDLNLDASAVAGEPGGTFSTPVQVIDSLGNSHMLTLTFSKAGANTWNYAVSIPGEEVADGTAGTPYVLPDAAGTLTFDDQGKLTDPPRDAGEIPIAVSGLAKGAANLSINWSLYGTDLAPRVTQYAEKSAAADASANGTPSGHLTDVKLSDGGKLMAHYSNGKDQLVGQLGLASIRNPDSLVSVGNNNLQASAETAQPVIGPPAAGGLGQVLGGSLESSTADVAHEFTTLIVMQRAYQANARVITTTDQLMQDTLGLKQV